MAAMRGVGPFDQYCLLVGLFGYTATHAVLLNVGLTSRRSCSHDRSNSVSLSTSTDHQHERL